MRGVEQIPWLYDGFMSLTDAMGLRRWRRWLAAGSRGRVLEIGAGTGRSLPLHQNASRVVAVEPNADAIRRARIRTPNALIVRANAEALPFRDDAFDTVVSSLVFCSVDDPDRGLEEIRRVLRPDGTLRMLEHVRSTNRFGAWLQDAVAPLWCRLTGGCHPNRRTEESVERAGFRIDRSQYRKKRTLRRFVARP